MAKLRVILALAALLTGGTPEVLWGAPNTSASLVVDIFGVEAPHARRLPQNSALPRSSVISLTQTRDGYLWLGTLGGLVRFDGARFTIFDEANTPGLASSRIVHVFEDSQTNLWIGSETAGVSLVREGMVVNLPIGQGRESRLVSTSEDERGAVWLYTADGQLFRYFNREIKPAALGAGYFSNCRVVAAEKNGSVWVGTDTNLFRLSTSEPRMSEGVPEPDQATPMSVDFLLAGSNGGCWRLANGRIGFWRTNQQERDFGEYPWREGIRVAAACEDSNGNLIVGTLGDGVFWFDAGGNYTHIGTTNGLGSDWALSLCVDGENNLWVGTDGGGLNRVRRTPFSVAAETRGLVAQSVCEGGDGGLWIGFNGNGIFHRTDGDTRRYGAADGLWNLNVWSVFADSRQRLWAGTWEGLHVFDEPTGEFLAMAAPAIGQRVLAIHQDRQARLWFGAQNGLLCWDEREWKLYTTNDGLSSVAVRAIVDDAEGNIWIGTMGGGLNRLTKDGFKSFTKSDSGLPSNDVSSLYEDGDGALWIGTFGSGLARFKDGVWTRYTTREGLVSNGISYMIEDGLGHFWIGSAAGLMRVPKTALERVATGETNFVFCRVYGTADGLPTRECTQGSQPNACRTRDGKLWFPTIKGLVSVDPAALEVNPDPPAVLIESVLIGGNADSTNSLRTAPPQHIVVPPRTEQLDIRYTSLNLSAPDPARTEFRYRMEGHELRWTEAGDNRVAHYTILPPGNYVFHVSARNEDGVWSEAGGRLAVTVLPAFWQTGWFRTIVAIVVVGIIAGIVYMVSTQKLQRQVAVMRQKEALERDRARIARDLHDQLGASLTQVALLGEMVESDKDLPAEVEEHGLQISKTARETTRVLDEIVWAVNPQNDTLDGLITYICKNAQEYLAVAGLRFRFEVPTQLPATPIAPEVRHNVFLAVKEAVTNIVRHAQATEARLRLEIGPADFTLEIQDNGRGIDLNKPQTRNGLRNMRKRMDDIGGGFSIGPAADGGTVVKLTAPIRTA